MSCRTVELNLCRICSKLSSNFTKQNAAYKKTIFGLLSQISDLEIITDERLSSIICCNCTLEFQKSKEFLTLLNSTNEKIINNYQLSESCRICLKEFFESNPFHIYKTLEGIEDCRNYNELIAKISRANINRPELQYFCTNCYNSLNNFQLFKMKIIKSEIKHMKKINKSIIPKFHEIKLEHDPIEVKEENEKNVVEIVLQDPLEKLEIDVKEESKNTEEPESLSEIQQTAETEISSKASTLKTFKCSHEGCNLEFFTKIERFHHMKLAGHLNEIEISNRQYHCYCGLIFTSKREQLNHIRLTHNARFKCNSCGRVVFDEKTCQSHIRKTHGSGFFTVGLLTKGINENNGKEVFKCSICDLDFEDFPNYKIHLDGIEHYENGTHYYDGGNDESRQDFKLIEEIGKKNRMKGLQNQQLMKNLNNQQNNSNSLQFHQGLKQNDEILHEVDMQIKDKNKSLNLEKNQKCLQKIAITTENIDDVSSNLFENAESSSITTKCLKNSTKIKNISSKFKQTSKDQNLNKNPAKINSKLSSDAPEDSESYLNNLTNEYFNKFINPNFTNSSIVSPSSNVNQHSSKQFGNSHTSVKVKENLNFSIKILSDSLETSSFFDPLKIEKPEEITIIQEFNQKKLNFITNDEKLINFHPVVELERIKIEEKRINLKEFFESKKQVNIMFDSNCIKVEDDRSQLVIMNENVASNETNQQNSTIIDQNVTCETCNKTMASSFYHNYHLNAPFHKFFLEFPQFRPQKTKRQQKLSERIQLQKMKFPCDVCQKGIVAAYYKIHLKSSSHKFYLSNSDAERKKRKPRSRNEDFSKDILIEEYDSKKSLALVCDYCRKKFFKKYQLENHVKRHCSSFYVVPCTFCNEKFLNQSAMNIHRKKNHASNDGSYHCEICNKSYERHREFLRHCASVGHLKILNGGKALKEEKRSSHIKENYTCFICNQNFSNGDSYKRHCGTYHVDGNEFCTRRYKTTTPFTDVNCKLCFENFETPNDLQIHYIMDHDNSESFKHMGKALLTCHCGKMLSRNLFKIHVDKFHPASTVCEICGINFGKNRAGFRYHRQYGHLPFLTCDVCGYKVQSMIRLKKHIQRHLNIINHCFVCEICGKSYGNQNHLDRHIQNNHEGEKISKIYECDQCEKKYKCPKSLKEHKMYKHQSAERIFKLSCEICGLKFEKMCKYKNHAKTTKHIEKANSLGVPIFDPKNI